MSIRIMRRKGGSDGNKRLRQGKNVDLYVINRRKRRKKGGVKVKIYQFD